MRIESQLQPGEEILYRAYVTRLTLAPLVAVVAAGLVIAAVAWFQFQNAPGALVALAVAVVAGLIFAWKDFIRRANDYVLTNHRIIQEIGVLSRRSMDSRLDKINNVEHRQTLWGRLLNYGDVEIDTASETGAALFRNISHPLPFKNAILAAAEQYRGAGRMPLAAPAGPSGAERMRQLKALLDDGLISPEEYEAKRRELLSQL
ncbi:MAG TPA: PH domain-containing protein [Thermoanaerobaculia bacterium]|nr:PH domain-containing protein [Thermoanaerobaculia bacterium]